MYEPDKIDTLIFVYFFFFTFFLCIFFKLIYFAVGRREPCSNEGEEVAVDSIKDMKCFKCICQVSYSNNDKKKKKKLN